MPSNPSFLYSKGIDFEEWIKSLFFFDLNFLWEMQFRVFKLRDNSFSRVYNYAIFYNHVKREIQALSSLQSSIKVRKIKTKKC